MWDSLENRTVADLEELVALRHGTHARASTLDSVN
jgi:hypothetical protein